MNAISHKLPVEKPVSNEIYIDTDIEAEEVVVKNRVMMSKRGELK